MKLPSGWTKSLLHHIAYVQTGLSKSEQRKGPSGKRPYLRVANVQDGYLDLTEIKEIDVPVGQLERFLLQKDDIVLTEGGDFDKLGRGCVWKGQIPECVHQNHIFAVRVLNKSLLIPQFLAYQMQSNYGRKYFLSCAKQTTNLASVNASQLKEFPVILPSYEVQKYIVEHLTTWDAAVEKMERLIGAKQHTKIALMLKLLVEDNSFKGYRKSWQPFHLGELFSERCETGHHNLPLLSITGESGIIFRDGGNRKDSSSEDKTNYLRICPGDIGYNTMRMWQGVSALSSLEGIVSPAYTVCTPKNGVDGQFMAYLFKVPRVINLFYRHSQGLTSDTWNLKFHNFAKIKVTIPDIEEQKAIVKVLSVCGEEIRLLKMNLEAIKKQKRGLMQKLLTGEWRVKTVGEVS